MSDQRCSDSDQSKRDIPSFIEPRPPLISNPFMRPRPQKGTNLLELFDEDSEFEEAEWVQVYLRLKPCNVKSNLYEVKSDRCLITSVDTATAGHGRRTQHNVSKMYTFSHIFGPESSQKEIFENVVKDNLKRLTDGHNFTLLTYGASGSGKTYTLMGTVESPGLVPRALEYVFRVVDAAQQPLCKPSDSGAEKLGYAEQEYELQFVKRLRQVSAPLRDKYRRMSVQLKNDFTQSTFDLSNRTRYYIWVSFVEIYNEGIYDLLTQSDRSKATSKLRIREDTNGNAYVKGATQAFVRSGAEAYDVMVAGKHNLQVAATGVHAHSSRSHCIFTITMLTETETGVRTSCVRLCDLAGCERAQKTKNTGARMQESRAINSSLHVLERCLNMLRRKQRQRVDSTLVPYRESKLTRLLGAGLSGAKGEAVSMVVTLNPAPQYSQETKHVLQLAAVARDIQVNHTIAETTMSLEFSSTDTTMEISAEVMKLRADNERLHFELVQAQARNRELLASMEAKQREMAKTMSEIAEEAKDMTKQYYESVLQSLRNEMEEMKDEYESRLEEVQSVVDHKRPPSDVGTPSRSSQKKIAQLMTEIAILEEKLTAEKLARARAEEEVQHLRACIEERDEKSEHSENNDEVEEVTDSEEDSEDEESCNESLEPTFKKEDINRSRLLQKSILSNNILTANDSKLDAFDDNDSVQEDSNVNDSLVEKSDATIKDDDISKDETAKSSTYITGVHEFTDNFGETFTNSSNDTQNDVSELKRDSPGKNSSERGTYFVRISVDKDVSNENNKSNDDEGNAKTSAVRGTYFVANSEKTTDRDSGNDSKNSARGTYFVKDSKLSQEKNDRRESSFQDASICVEPCPKKVENNMAELVAKHDISQISHVRCHESDVSLAQFEQLEKVANTSDTKATTTELFHDVKILKEKRFFFSEKPDKDSLNVNIEKNKTYFDNIDINIDKNLAAIKNTVLYDDRSPSIVKDEVAKDFEPSKIKILLGESFTRQPEVLSSVRKVVMPKKHVSVDIFEGFDSPVVKPTDNTDSLLSHAVEKKYHLQSVQKDEKHPQKSDMKAETVEKSNASKLDMDSKDKDVTHKDDESKSSQTLDTSGKINVSVNAEAKDELSIVESTRISIEKMVLEQKAEIEKSEMKPVTNDVTLFKEPERLAVASIKEHTDDIVTGPVNNSTQAEDQINTNNTTEVFEKIYKDITVPRATEFDLMISQELSSTTNDVTNDTTSDADKRKYNLRHKKGNTSKKDDVEQREAQTELKRPQRSLRLRRRNNQENEKTDLNDKPVKLNDILNLQKEFSDVTLDVPAKKKDVKDIPSPEKHSGDDENVPPMIGAQSCPSKSVSRSRRKLFTPRAEVLDESIADGESGGRVCVPRPSFHRPRARRKL